MCDKLLMVDKGTVFSQKFHNKIYVTIFLKKNLCDKLLTKKKKSDISNNSK